MSFTALPIPCIIQGQHISRHHLDTKSRKERTKAFNDKALGEKSQESSTKNSSVQTIQPSIANMPPQLHRPTPEPLKLQKRNMKKLTSNKPPQPTLPRRLDVPPQPHNRIDNSPRKPCRQSREGGAVYEAEHHDAFCFCFCFCCLPITAYLSHGR